MIITFTCMTHGTGTINSMHNRSGMKMIITFTCITHGTGTINSMHNRSGMKMIITFTCLTYGTGTINSPTSMSPIDLERHKPPGQQRRGPTCKVLRV